MKKQINFFTNTLCSLLIVFFITTSLYGQVGIGTTNPNSNALLDVDATNTPGGILLPRVALTSTTSPAPLTADVAGMIIYNTATINDVTPGYYFNDGTDWIQIAAATAANEWALTGNTGTTAATNFVGTTDTQALRFRTNNTEAFEISGGNVTNRGKLRAMTNGTATLPVYSFDGDSDLGLYRIGANQLGVSAGQVSINNNAPIAGDRFSAFAADTEDAVNGYTTTGTGVYGENGSGIGNGVFGNSSNIGVRGFGAHGALLESGLNAGFGAIAWNSTAFGVNRTGLIAIGQNLAPINFPGTGAILYGSTSGGASFANSATGTGILGVGNAGTTAYSLANGSGLAGTGTTTGVYGLATATSGSRQGAYFTMNKAGAVSPTAADDPVAILAGYNGTEYFGGYFDGNQDNNAGGSGGNAGEDYAYVGIRSGGTTYKILGTGSNSTMINDSEGNKRVLFSPEAPEILFEDYGTGQLVNGKATITLDPILSSAIYVSNDHPLKVFIQLEGDCNGVFVTNKSKNGFTVTELKGGRSNAPFSWHVVANRANSVGKNGQLLSKHIDVRFPIGPSKIKPLEVDSNKTKPAEASRAKTQSKKTIKSFQHN